MMWKELISLIRKIFSSITRVGSIGISMLEVSKFKLQHYGTMTKILIFMLRVVISSITNLIIWLSQGLRPIYVIVQWDVIANQNTMWA